MIAAAKTARSNEHATMASRTHHSRSATGMGDGFIVWRLRRGQWRRRVWAWHTRSRSV